MDRTGLIAIAHQRIIAIEGECDHSNAPTECELEASLAEVTGLIRGAHIDGQAGAEPPAVRGES